MTKDAARKKTVRALMGVLNQPYMLTSQIYDGHVCAFGLCRIPYGPDDELLEVVGEYWSVTAQASVLAHPDCTPKGHEAIMADEDPEWKMA